MGHHYVPQKYLTRFSDPTADNEVWQYDKADASSRRLPIPAVAQSPGFYTPDEEVKLASLVEGPADPVIQKLILGQSLADRERLKLALYIGVMLHRVPYHRSKTYEAILPSALQETFDQIRNELVTSAEAWGVDPLLVSARLAQLTLTEGDYAREPPASIHRAVRKPWPTPKIVVTVYDMAWRVVEATKKTQFMTSDNPAFYFESYGIGNPESELTFPLSTSHCLHASWQGPTAGLCFLQANDAIAREFNRRTASGSDRFAFYHRDADWVLRLLQKSGVKTNRIQWQGAV